MISKDTFSGYHPIVNFIYFALVIGFAMFFMHPICLGVSLVSAFLYYIILDGKKAVFFFFKYCVPVMLLTGIINPAFNHQGNIIICYLPKGNPLTLESIIYGVAAATMLASVLMWFACFTEVFTSDKFVYLFGRIIPALSLVLSMSLRFIPRFTKKMREISHSRRVLYAGTKKANSLKIAFASFSMAVTWAFENSIETADSMKSRGYGLKGRTAYSIYRFGKHDAIVLTWILLCGVFIIVSALLGNISWRYFPSIRGVYKSPMTIMTFIVYLLLCITPMTVDGREAKAWK